MTTVPRQYITATQQVSKFLPEATDILRVVYKTDEPNVWKLRYSNESYGGVRTIQPPPDLRQYFELLQE